MLNELLLFYCCWKAANSHIFSSRLLVRNLLFIFLICKPSASLHHVTQTKEDDGYDPERKGTHRRGESLPHRSYSHGNEGEVCCWEPAGQDVRDTVSFPCHITNKWDLWSRVQTASQSLIFSQCGLKLGGSFCLVWKSHKIRFSQKKIFANCFLKPPLGGSFQPYLDRSTSVWRAPNTLIGIDRFIGGAGL